MLPLRAGWCDGSAPAQATAKPAATLGYSTYGMKTLKTEAAIQAVDEIGFDAIEIAVRSDWDSAPGKMPAARRAAVKRQLADTGLQLRSLMEHLLPSDNDKQHAAHLQRLAGVFELGHDLAEGQRPLVQTVLGGGKWEERRTMLRDRVGDWAALAQKHQMVLAIKPHRGGGMSRPSEAIWLMQQLGQPEHLQMVYDYSHYAFRDMTLDETISTALPYTAHVAVKDPVEQENQVVFQLPGTAGTIDYARLIRKFYDGGYRGDFNCEVSGMVWSQKNYDPLDAARRCYKSLAAAFEKSGVPRGSKGP